MNADIKHIIVIESLEESEGKTGAILHTDIIERYLNLYGDRSPVVSSKFHSTETKVALLETLDDIIKDIDRFQNGLVIHFEMHGSKNLNGLVTASKELVTWAELIEKFRVINIATNNELYITMATCYGRHLFEAVKPGFKSPYRGYISASQEVFIEDVMDGFTDIFERLIIDGNLIRSYLASDAEHSRFFYKDSEETFRQLMEQTFERLKNDPTYKDEILDHSALRQIYDKGLLPDDLLTAMMHDAFASIYSKHKKAFEFITDES